MEPIWFSCLEPLMMMVLGAHIMHMTQITLLSPELKTLERMDKENAHDALQDVKDTANLLIAFMKLIRRVSPSVKFEKAFADGNIHL